MIVVTEKAAKKALQLASQQGKAAVLRLGVKGGGCSGMSYSFDFDATPRETDHTWEAHGLTVVCDAKSMAFLEGCELDYDSNILRGGFRWSNPQARRTCSCGESFTI